MINKIFISLALLQFTFGCTSSPTGRRQLLLFPESQMDQMGVTSFSQMTSKVPTLKDPKTVSYIRCITDKLLIAMGEQPNLWAIEVFKDDSPNAFALPGKKMGIHTGMISLAKNTDQLAAVIGHEIGHVLAQHSNERMSQSTLTNAGLQVSAVALGASGKQTDGLILAALGMGAQFGVLLPFSRSHETEADRLGQMYMAKAGFNPREAAELWKLMSSASGGKEQPEFLSTHPSPSSRIKDLSSKAEKYMASYQAAQPKPQCKK